MKEVNLRGGELCSMAEIHRAFAETLRFPDWYGGNLDALYDLLTAEQEEVRIVLWEEELLRDALGARYRALRRVLRDAAEENENITLVLADAKDVSRYPSH